MVRHTTHLIAAVLLSAIATSRVRAQTATLNGIVLRDSLGLAVGGADVSIPDLGLRATTNHLGEFRFRGLPAGRIVVQVRRLGFAPFGDTVTIVDGQVTNREFQLTPRATQLDSVTVTAEARKNISPGLTAFEERRKEGHGYFVSGNLLRRNDDRTMLDIVVGQIPGLDRSRVPPGRFYVDTMRKCAAGPEILYAGVEYYPGGASTPLQFNATDAGCGVLVLWTRER